MDTKRQLNLFFERALELQGRRFVQGEFSPKFSIKWTRDHTIRWELREPDEEDLRSFLMTFRQFISDKEPVFINRIYNILHQALTGHDTLRGYLVKSRAGWKWSLRTTGGKIFINQREYTPEYITDLLINGYYFHNDEEKIDELKRLVGPDLMVVKSQFYFFLSIAMSHVFYVANLYAHANREGVVSENRIEAAISSRLPMVVLE